MLQIAHRRQHFDRAIRKIISLALKIFLVILLIMSDTWQKWDIFALV